MPDREKVVKGLTVCTKPGTKGCFYDMKECPYEENGCRVALMHDALALLKEHEPVKPIPPTDESEMWRCGNCHHQIFRCTHQRFCERCGHEVKWE